MSIPNKLRFLFAVVPCLLVGMAHAATVVGEQEPNDPIDSAQPLSAVGGVVTINGEFGNGAGSGLDYYMFWANAGDKVTIDIDNAYDVSGIDTVLAVFDDSPNHYIVPPMDDNTTSLDPGSLTYADARIDDWVAPNTGYYIVGVAAMGLFPKVEFQDGGGINTTANLKQGTYTLIITGASQDPNAKKPKQVPVIIRSDEHGLSPRNRRGHSTIPVVIESMPGFDPMTVDTSTLTFGPTGNEDSLTRCNTIGGDINHDGIPDLLCHFRANAADFQATDDKGTVRGKFGQDKNNMSEFEGTVDLKVDAGKRHHGRHHEWRDSRRHDRH